MMSINRSTTTRKKIFITKKRQRSNSEKPKLKYIYIYRMYLNCVWQCVVVIVIVIQYSYLDLHARIIIELNMNKNKIFSLYSNFFFTSFFIFRIKSNGKNFWLLLPFDSSFCSHFRWCFRCDLVCLFTARLNINACTRTLGVVCESAKFSLSI